jgi:hypothetical protein
MSCLHHTNYISFMHLLDHVREEPESEDQPEQESSKLTPSSIKASSDAFHQLSLAFLESLSYVKIDCALSV